MKTKILLALGLALFITLTGLAFGVYEASRIQSEINTKPVTDIPSDLNFKDLSAELRLGMTKSVPGVEITPLQILSDSRCPVDVTCIWAGTVSLKIHIKTEASESDISLDLGETKKIGIYLLGLTAVEPQKYSEQTLNQQDYIFTFKITKESN